VKNKISRGLGIVSKAGNVFNIITLISLCYALIYPYLMYCVKVWGGVLSSYKDELIKIQKNIVRVMASFNPHSPPIFKTLNIMTFDYIYNYFLSIFKFKVTKHLHPQTLPLPPHLLWGQMHPTTIVQLEKELLDFCHTIDQNPATPGPHPYLRHTRCHHPEQHPINLYDFRIIKW